MEYVKPIKVKGKIVELIDKRNYLVYVEELDTNVHTTISGKLLMNFYHKLQPGTEMIIEVSAIDKTKGRFFRGSANLFGY